LERATHKLPQGENTKYVADLTDGTLRHTRRLTSLLDQLLDLTRLRLGTLEIKREKCDLSAIVHDVASQLGVEAAKNGSKISISAPSPVIGFFDPTRMGQVATNLLSNAIKYGDGSPIEISVKSQGGKAVLSVRDQGMGIPEAVREKIFERFERAESEGNISGLGLGLYITKQIVDAHGGTISVESSPGQGSTFVVELQLANSIKEV
jgi:signal transduction histidine kinase